MRKPIPYKEPQKKENFKIDKPKLKNISVFILVEAFLIILSVTLVAVISIIFGVSILIPSIFIAIFLSIASYFIAIKFLKK